jgi:hypothetical protein
MINTFYFGFGWHGVYLWVFTEVNLERLFIKIIIGVSISSLTFKRAKGFIWKYLS